MLEQALGLSGLDLLLVELNLRNWLSDGLDHHIYRVALGAGLRARPGAICHLSHDPNQTHGFIRADFLLEDALIERRGVGLGLALCHFLLMSVSCSQHPYLHCL